MHITTRITRSPVRCRHRFFLVISSIKKRAGCVDGDREIQVEFGSPRRRRVNSAQMSTTALVFAVGLGLAIAAPGCSFVPDRDYSDPAGPVLTSSTPEECCQKCLGLPSCLTAVFADKFPALPVEVISHIVLLWAHCGDYDQDYAVPRAAQTHAERRAGWRRAGWLAAPPLRGRHWRVDERQSRRLVLRCAGCDRQPVQNGDGGRGVHGRYVHQRG